MPKANAAVYKVTAYNEDCEVLGVTVCETEALADDTERAYLRNKQVARVAITTER